jgi:hypothetical protein
MQVPNVFAGQFHGIEGAISRFSVGIVRRFVGVVGSKVWETL